MEDNVSKKLANTMIEALEASPDFEGKSHTRCVIYIDSENPNPPKPESGMPASLDRGYIEDIFAGKIRIGDGYTSIYGDFFGDNDYVRTFIAHFHVLQLLMVPLTDYIDLDGMEEVIDHLEDAVEGIQEVMKNHELLWPKQTEGNE